MDYFIVAITSVAGLYFHWWLYVRIKRWMDRDLALSLAGDCAAKRSYMPKPPVSRAVTYPPGLSTPPENTPATAENSGCQALTEPVGALQTEVQAVMQATGATLPELDALRQ